MLKRRADHRAPPQPAVRRRVGLAARAAACPTVVDTTTAAWRRASCLAERERAALEHYEQLGRQAHPVCQICQEAIRARLQHESIRYLGVRGSTRSRAAKNDLAMAKTQSKRAKRRIDAPPADRLARLQLRGLPLGAFGAKIRT